MDIPLEVSSELLPGEVVVWVNRPKQGLVLRASQWGRLPFSLMWGGFAIFWETMVVVMAAPLFPRAWGIPFVVTGLSVMMGCFFIDAWLRARTTYVITNRRVMIRRSGALPRTTSFRLDALPELATERHRDGTSTIVFGPKSAGRGQPASPRFDGIDDGETALAFMQGQLPERSYRAPQLPRMR